MSDDNEAKVRRAREVLADAGWLFDEFVEAEQNAWLRTPAEAAAKREQHYHRAHVASGMRAYLQAIVDEADTNQKMERLREEQREKLKEKPHVR